MLLSFIELSRRFLFLLTVIAAAALCFVGYRAGNLLGGWAGENFWDGCARISYSFLAGMLIYRSNWIIKNKLGFLGMAVLLILAFIMPWSDWNVYTELFVVLIYFPFTCCTGCRTTLSSGFKGICEFSGKISYPLYMVHYAGIWMFGNYFTSHKPDTTQLTYIIIIGTMLMLALAYVVMVIYDTPVRKYLNKKRQQG